MGNACSADSEPICNYCHKQLKAVDADEINLDLGFEMINISLGNTCKCSHPQCKASDSRRPADATHKARKRDREKTKNLKQQPYTGRWVAPPQADARPSTEAGQLCIPGKIQLSLACGTTPDAASTDDECRSSVATAETSTPCDQISDWSSQDGGLESPRSIPEDAPEPEVPAVRVLQAFTPSLQRFEALNNKTHLQEEAAKTKAESTLADAVEWADSPEALNGIIFLARLAGAGREALQRAEMKQRDLQCRGEVDAKINEDYEVQQKGHLKAAAKTVKTIDRRVYGTAVRAHRLECQHSEKVTGGKAITEVSEEDGESFDPVAWLRQESGASTVSTASGASLESWGSD